MLTAAVRDLHLCYPGRFVTGVKTSCPEFWENNPYVSELSEDDPEVRTLDCHYPLINHCNETPYHCLHGFIAFLNERLNLSIKPTAFKGDIHLSAQEKAWYSQVHEVTRQETPFWIVAAGGKYDVTIKWWETSRYQEVVDHFRDRVLFVQVGQLGHHHPKVDGVIDLRGKTNLRELVRLVYHSQGVLCPVTALMHLAAAVPRTHGDAPRPCVVVAGGREPAYWEAYPDHQFIHTNGALACCAGGGCWRDRAFKLRDGDQRDRSGRLCVNLNHGLPRCMDMIAPAEVIRRIEMYFAGGACSYLLPRQRVAAARGIRATAQSDYDQQRLSLHNAGMACERFIQTIPPYPGGFQARGIVICGGGVRYFTGAWVCIQMLRRLGCGLPIELWFLGRREMDGRMKDLVASLGVDCVDAQRLRRKFPARILNGWELKPYAILHSRFREVLLLDADNVPVVNPEFLFDVPQFRETGAIFWPDYPPRPHEKSRPVWRSCGLRAPDEPEFETGQVVVDKERCWRALCLAMWFNENSDFYYQHVHGDKETFHLAFRKMRQPYALVPKPIHTLSHTMCQHDFEGRRIFQHRNTDKWDPFLCNRRVKGFWFEDECRKSILELRRLWDGRLSSVTRKPVLKSLTLRLRGGAPRIEAVMISCVERAQVRERTLENLARTDWNGSPLSIEIDASWKEDHQQRRSQYALLALRRSLERNADYILFLEDDLDFNRHIRHNLAHWGPLQRGEISLASLYNPRLREQAVDLRNNARIIAPGRIFGSQAFVISRIAVEYIVRNWNRVAGLQDIKIPRLAGRLGRPILYHAPSLVQHIGTRSTWGAGFHQAMDFDPHWKSGPA